MKKPLLLSLFAAGLVTATLTETSAQTPFTASWGTKIGQTTYDLQSNYAPGNRLFRHSDGSLSAVWTEQCTISGGTWPDRGIGYNYMNAQGQWTNGPAGTCPDQFGISSVRVGWPEVVGYPSGKEMIVSHTPLQAIERAQKGTGAWSSNANISISGTAEGDTWPRMVVAGNTTHLIASNNGSVNGLTGGISYYRSTDEGATWTHVALPGHAAGAPFTNGFGGDSYAIHANGNTVAIAAGDAESDWVMWKSTDAGLTFTRNTIRQFDIADVGADSIYVSNDPYQAILVDNNGRVHVWAGVMAYGIQAATPATPSNTGYNAPTYFPTMEGLWYWNDAMAANSPELIVEEREDVHPAGSGMDWVGNGSYLTPSVIPRYYGSMTSMANAAVDADNNVYVIYSGVVEGTSNTFDSTGQSFRDLYIMRTTNGGTSWSDPINISNALGAGRTDLEEDVFPSVARVIGSDNIVHVIWQSDDEPGLHVRGDLDDETINGIMYAGIDVSNWPNLITARPNNVDAFVNNINLYPNPTTGTTTVNVDLKQHSNLQVRVTNLLGQEVTTIPSFAGQIGPNNVAVDLSAQAAGIYMVSIVSDSFSVTKRLVKQ